MDGLLRRLDAAAALEQRSPTYYGAAWVALGRIMLTTSLLGDAENWDDLKESASIIVGSADTVHARIMEILESAKVGHLLIQFHLGNMPDALTRKSMRLFATQVAPRLRADSARLFGREYPDMERQLEAAK